MNAEQRRAWRRYVFGCADLTVAQRLVLLALETFADWPAGTNARPGVSRLAELCGLKTSVVEKALARGRGLGLIQQTGRANPRRGLAAVYRLVPVPVSTRTDVQVEDGSTHTGIRVDEDFNPYENEVQPVRNDDSTRTDVQPTNPLTPIQNTEGGSTGGDDPLRQDGMQLEEEPPRHCPKHRPHGTTRDCWDCGEHRKNHERWEADQPKRAAKAKEAAIAACAFCDEDGFIDTGVDEYGNDTVDVCKHALSGSSSVARLGAYAGSVP